ncbi:VPLPA-CTERM sorting domain-containing protein [Paracoccus caeni]|uniref:VPLPA-CTERM sorting domain-containing protein n=1 Tax=Paracoccus caeni TaxID=657651 RepID=A0A934SGY3_9RHOB|nr:VPLPA-CTERM sorting domain-containing protein [Paracoccus caeni]MBK4217239.1 VPLPA-CTERM sorting domain-containing protein [Paracoccus caeni]
MLIKASLAGCLALGLTCQVAGAATFNIENFDILLRYDGTSISRLIGTLHENPADTFEMNIDQGQYDYDVAEYTHLQIGEIVSFKATISFPVPEPDVTGGLGNGGSASVCEIGRRDCTDVNYTSRRPDSVFIAVGDSAMIDVPLTIGSQTSHYFWGLGMPSIVNNLGTFNYADQHAYFTVVDIIDQPAPIPLPAAALMLPAAIGGFAFFRRRKSA